MPKDILKNKLYLYMTEFFAGMGVMAVELGASRLLAPYFSSSQIVWTIIIGTIMIAMALGNIYGGRSADKNPDPNILYRRLIIAAIWISLIPVLGKYIIILISGALIFTINTNFLIVAAFAACMVIFVFPLFLLGTVTPSLAKYTMLVSDENTSGVKSDGAGSIVGQLGAANTIGSIIGTFLPTFVTIPAVGTAVTFLIFSGIILLIGIFFFISRRSHIKLCLLAIVVYIICIIFGNSDSFAFWQPDLTYEGESVYNYLQVAEDDRSVRLSTNVLFGVQSITMKDDSLTGMYYDYAMAAPVLAGGQTRSAHSTPGTADSAADTAKTPAGAPNTAAAAFSDGTCDVLVLGMGTGTFARQCMRYFDDMKVEGVEIDDKITDLSYRYFDASKDIPVTTYDGRAFLQTIDKTYDVIMVDAYQDISIPFQMSSVEFFTEVYDHLEEGGVMVVNMNMHSDNKENINEYLSDTIASVFPSVAVVDVEGSTNRELFATKTGDVIARFHARLDDISRNVNIDNDINNPEEIQQRQVIELMETVGERLHEHAGGDLILTDDRAPVEVLGMREIDTMIRDEVEYYKAIYEREGLEAVIAMFM